MKTYPFQRLLVSAILVVALCSGVFDTLQLHAQQATITTPHWNMQDSWYESLGSSMFLNQRSRRGGWFFNWGAPVYPAYGGYAGRDAHFGFGFRNGNLRGGFNLWASQGSERSMRMTAPFLTVLHGGYGSISHGSWQPFVTGWTPVIGGQPQWQSPLKMYLNSPEGVQFIRQQQKSSPGDVDAEPIEHRPQTIPQPRTDPPLQIINGKSTDG
jgi:hypothetical protein